MSKENEAINEYIQQQQTRINELMQMIVMLETKNKLLEKENKLLSDINSKNLDKLIPRKGLKEQIKDNSQKINAERKSPEKLLTRQKLNGLRVNNRKSPEESMKKQTMDGLSVRKTRIVSEKKR